MLARSFCGTHRWARFKRKKNKVSEMTESERSNLRIDTSKKQFLLPKSHQEQKKN